MLQLPNTSRLVAFVLALLLAFVLACAATSSANQRMAAGRIQRMAAVRLAPCMRSMAECRLVLHAHATALAICAHTSPACGPCAREIKIAPFHTWGYEGRPWTSNDCAQASHTEKNARAHDFSQKRCDAYDRSRPPVNAARTHFAPRDSCRPYIQHVRCASITYNTI